MPFARWNGSVRSIRVRLTLWNTFVLLLTVLAAFWALRLGLREVARQETDELIQEDMLELSYQFEQLWPDKVAIEAVMNRKALAHAHRGVFIQTLDPEGRVEWSSHNTPLALQQLAAIPGEETISIDKYRVARKLFHSARIPGMRIRVGATPEPFEAHFAQLNRAMLMVGLLMVSLSPLGGFWLANRAIRPMAELIRGAEALQPTQLEQRLPVRQTNDELDQLSQTINRLLDRIAAYVEHNRQFVANAAHELRSPLAAIQTAVEVTGAAERTPEEYQELLDEVSEACSHLSFLVNQLLLLAESDTVGLQGCDEPVALDQVVRRSVEIFRAAAEDQAVTLTATVAPDVWVSGAAQHLRQVLNNLIDNCLKYTPAGGEVQVSLSRDDARQQAVLRVSDTGVGISVRDLPHIFEPFYRGDRARSRGAKQSGTGLGLSICQAIVREHGGTIEVASQVNQGTAFTVRFPAWYGARPELKTAATLPS
ncbi:MAG: HAMP domain-containing histidine kinase [Pirellulales bacterium]|nr:HAMP domain-containing histidine kinase [Pirellulales bacterium]